MKRVMQGAYKRFQSRLFILSVHFYLHFGKQEINSYKVKQFFQMKSIWHVTAELQ